MTDLTTPAPDFEKMLQHALRSYAAEGVRSFEPATISAQARTARPSLGPSRWYLGCAPLFELRLVRLVLLVVLLGAITAALGVVGSRLVRPALLPGVIAVGGLGQILIVEPSSGTTHTLTAPTPHDTYPVWSPDGSRIALSQGDGRGQLRLVDADGGNPRPIAGDMTSREPVAWSPDGSRIAITGYHYPGGAGRGLSVVGSDGTGLTLLVPDTGLDISSPSWSPDGSMIAFTAFDPNRPVTSGTLSGAGRYVYVVDVASGWVTAVSSSIVDGAAQWRPGRAELLYTQVRKQFGELGHEDVVLAERVGDTWRERSLVTGLRLGATGLGPDNTTMPMWLDGNRFVYNRLGRLTIAGVDGRPEVPIGEPGLVVIAPGCVAPDGSEILVGAVFDLPPGSDPQPADRVELALVPTDGAASIRIPAHGVNLAACSWQTLHE